MYMGRSIAAFAAIVVVSTMPATAQNMSFGADNFYQSDKVSAHPITFKNLYGMSIAANLYKGSSSSSNSSSSSSSSGGGAPAIVVSHPFGAVKEQSANLYAQKLAEQGFVTVAFDHSFWGASDGEPRNSVSPDLFVEAYSAAVDYLGTQDFVDRERIGGLGICGSGSWLVSAAKIDTRIKAVATASMYDMGAATRNGLRHAQSLEQRRQIADEAARQRWVEAEGGAPRYTGGTPNELTKDTPPVAAEFYDFYRTTRGEFTPPGASEALTTHPTLVGFPKMFNFYPFNDIETISPRPLLFISGDQAHSREFSEDAYARAAEPKELYWVPRAGHVDLYDRVQLIPFEKLTDFFRTSL
ncbi:alpha/beta superfamily hydrolase [Beauveria bassiana ARSEF 2860]|uniref:Alpha/beta superfamily hydrolase n=1 Tax=Beauveria bassiana (strain ARSEF 2860) TaxID=655819 RepID=J4UVW6_BEAB2|nr:alpha/beta superfamily hydrolase [Beauveria bassiana ARSEF 2860]EJP70347.1 alpha/beta superfamily hydrolase [Beauveria bassiana ARSEF 2860]